jgi:hypothetical protein
MWPCGEPIEQCAVNQVLQCLAGMTVHPSGSRFRIPEVELEPKLTCNQDLIPTLNSHTPFIKWIHWAHKGGHKTIVLFKWVRTSKWNR